MKSKFKLLPLLLALVMVLGACGGGKEEDVAVQPEAEPAKEEEKKEEPKEEKKEEKEEKEEEVDEDAWPTQEELLAIQEDPTPSGTLTVGDSTQMNADFMWGWTNTSPNAHLKRMMYYGYQLVVNTPEQELIVNPVAVKEYTSTDNPDGTKTLRFEIYDNLTYNDGSPISAKDYIFQVLLMSSPEFVGIDGTATSGINLVGFDSFNKGYLVNEDKLAINEAGDVIETVDDEGKSTFSEDVIPCKTFEGIRMPDDYTIEQTIQEEELPSYYELSLVSGFPLPMHVIAPGVDITDSEDGVTISDEFTVDLIRGTVMDAENGYRYKPMVTAGAYEFESYDDATFTAVVKANPNFLCLWDGAKARIEKIVYKNTTQSTQLNELEAGTVDLIPSITTGSDIDQGFEMVDTGDFDFSAYPRNGYGKVAFHCDLGPTQFKEVRQALTYCLDRDEFGRQYSGGYAIVVDGRYAESQWMYQESKDELDDKLTKYTLNTDEANRVLDEGGWTLTADGGEYAGEGLRHKEVDGELMPLVIQWCASKDNVVSDLLSIMLPPNAEKVGMKIEQTLQDSVLDSYYRRNVEEPIFHMFNMGTGFGIPDSPWNNYSTDPIYWGGVYNSNYIADKDLESITQKMKRTDPEDREGFRETWVEYQVIWNDLLPDMPLYANIYHDFYSADLKEFESDSAWYLSESIPRAYLDR